MLTELRKTSGGPTLIDEQPIFDNGSFTIAERLVRQEDKQTRKRYVWDRRSQTFVVIAALTEDGKFLLVREPKYGVMERILNLPAGGVDPGENAAESARRELLEETGYAAGKIILLREKVIDFADKIAGGEHSFFLARGAVQVSDPEDLREPVLIDPSEARALLTGLHPKLKW